MINEDQLLQQLENYDGDSDYSDPEDFVDDITVNELLPEIMQQEPRLSNELESQAIVIDGLPKVTSDRLEKLQGFILKVFGKYGVIKSYNFPVDEKSGLSAGCAFIEYEKSSQSIHAIKAKHGEKLDKSHTYCVNSYSDLREFNKVRTEWKEPAKQPYKNIGNVLSFLENENCNDQFCIMFEGGGMTAIYENTVNEPSVIQERKRWTEKYVQWSPKGSFLGTIHEKGIALWGGKDFKQIHRFNHPKVSYINFSPCERYLLTLGTNQEQNLHVWEIFTGQQKRSFEVDFSNSNLSILFKWSSDGKYFARKTEGAISVYETPSMSLLDRKSISAPNVSQFAWSPKDNYLAYWVTEQDQIPARVTILHIPSRKEIRVKNLFNVQDICLYWHNDGRFLCVKVDRYNNSKKFHYSTFEIFHIHGKEVPVDIVEMKELVTTFSWEPKGNKFCCLHGLSAGLMNASFYEVKNGKVQLIETLERKAANHIFWSPLGQFLVLGQVDSNSQNSGMLEFVDTADMTVMSSGEHMGATELEWCPTGRFVTTTVSHFYQKEDTACWIWTFQGKLQKKLRKDELCQFVWRPRPPTVLTPEQIKKVKKDHKKYGKEFEAKDRLMQSRVSKDILVKRQEEMQAYRDYRQKCALSYQSDIPYRRELRNGVNTDEFDSNLDDDCTTLEVEVMIDEYEEIIVNDNRTSE